MKWHGLIFFKSWFRLLIKWFSKLVHIFLFWPLFKCRCWVCTIAKLDTANCTIGSARFDRIRIRNIFEYTYLCSNCVFFYSHAVHVKYIIHIIECILGVHFLLFWFFIFLYILDILDPYLCLSNSTKRNIFFESGLCKKYSNPDYAKKYSNPDYAKKY